MAKRDQVVIGGSAGSFAPLREILAKLPSDFPASVFVVLHVAENSPALLDRQLSFWSSRPVHYASDGEPIRPGQIYAARADHHLTVEHGKIRVQRGPRENRHRPAIDPLFRTAAREYGPRIIGVLLSGLDDDGSAGLFAVKQRGGIAMVQDPRDAAASEMPERAIEYASPHYILRSRDIAPNLLRLVSADQDEMVMPNRKPSLKPASRQRSTVEVKADENLNVAYFDEGEGMPSVFACPECDGVLWEMKDKKIVRFRCRVGHSYGVQSLSKELSQASETALWAAVRALEEKAAMQRRISEGLKRSTASARRLHDQAAAAVANARLLRDMIFRRDEELEAPERKASQAA